VAAYSSGLSGFDLSGYPVPKKRLEDRLCRFLPQNNALFSRLVTRLFFHGIKGSDPFDSLLGDVRALALLNLDEFAAHINHAGLLAGSSDAEQTAEAGKPIHCPAGASAGCCREGACTTGFVSCEVG